MANSYCYKFEDVSNVSITSQALLKLTPSEVQVIRDALNAGLKGLVFASGIPGTVGGAVVMNAGAYGGQMSDVLVRAKVLTDGEIRLAPGTMYGSLSKMEKDGLIRFVREEDKRKIYEITELGNEVLQLELKRISRLYRTAQGGI